MKAAMQALASRLITGNDLKWRWHGVGMVQAYIHEADDDEYRLHVWHPLLVLPGIRTSGEVHDHRFDLWSLSLAGTIEHKLYYPKESSKGTHSMWTFLPYRAAEGSPEMTELPGRYMITNTYLRSPIGDWLHLPKGLFHHARPVYDGVAVTLVHKCNQVKQQARVLAPHGYPPVKAFSGELTPELQRTVLKDAALALEHT